MISGAIKWVIGAAVLIGAIVAIYLILTHRQPDAVSAREFRDSIRVLQKRYDSLDKIIQTSNTVAANIVQQIDSARRRDSIYKNVIANQNAQIKKIKAEYAKNNFVNRLNRDKLVQFVSDSIPTERH